MNWSFCQHRDLNRNNWAALIFQLLKTPNFLQAIKKENSDPASQLIEEFPATQELEDKVRHTLKAQEGEGDGGSGGVRFPSGLAGIV